MSPELVSPWREFLEDLDNLLPARLDLHCIGGFAAVAMYGLPRSTNGLDYIHIESNNAPDLESIAGEGSPLAKKHKVFVHYVTIATYPEDYDRRLKQLFPNRFKNLRLLVLDPYDLVLSKLSRNSAKDQEDVKYLARMQHLDPEILRERYNEELRCNLIGPAERADNTLKFWIEAYFSQQ
ncbi:MAG TPA: DUF6036 family nucleotidyltransferase [Verrucomicrobiae bacterium]|nr:DUF6036 family nucleotidyltransferase [Verrucomicrobiae bacterium]